MYNVGRGKSLRSKSHLFQWEGTQSSIFYVPTGVGG